jgi:hypothetical protein
MSPFIGMRNQPTHDLGTLSGRAAPPRAAFMPRIHTHSAWAAKATRGIPRSGVLVQLQEHHCGSG